jgi:predicted lipoprotein with Yx(FWY)xxD motif
MAFLALSLVIGGCGGAAPRKQGGAVTHPIAPSSAPASTAIHSSPPSSSPMAVVKVMHTEYGNILVDGTGRALYLFTRDSAPQSRCYGACARNWPPFLAAGQPSATAQARAGLLGRTPRHDGSHQVTYRGHPLYYYIGDRHPGEVLCQDVEEFGGHWYVVARSGNAVL